MNNWMFIVIQYIDRKCNIQFDKMALSRGGGDGHDGGDGDGPKSDPSVSTSLVQPWK